MPPFLLHKKFNKVCGWTSSTRSHLFKMIRSAKATWQEVKHSRQPATATSIYNQQVQPWPRHSAPAPLLHSPPLLASPASWSFIIFEAKMESSDMLVLTTWHWHRATFANRVVAGPTIIKHVVFFASCQELWLWLCNSFHWKFPYFEPTTVADCTWDH